MKNSNIFKLGFIVFTILVLSCNKDEIKVSNSEYISGGTGTSQTTGAVEFNFKIPSNYTSGRVSVELVTNTTIQREANGNGDHQLQFLNLSPGNYDYTFEFSAMDNNIGSINNPAANILFSLNETLEVQNGKTLKIRVVLD